MTQDLIEKVAIVTGAARGIEAEIAAKLFHRGPVLVMADLDEAVTSTPTSANLQRLSTSSQFGEVTMETAPTTVARGAASCALKCRQIGVDLWRSVLTIGRCSTPTTVHQPTPIRRKRQASADE